MNLRKRDCGVKIELTPTGSQFLGVDFDFYGKTVTFGPASTMGEQFGAFVNSLYELFPEADGEYRACGRRKIHTEGEEHRIVAVTSTVDWDNEGDCMSISMTRYISGEKANYIFLRVSTDYEKTFEEYIIKDRDLCYAVAKACTDALKKYGIYGYKYSTEYDTFSFHRLLFIKAYALECAEIRELTNVDEYGGKRTDFEKEIQVLLFDM